MVLKTIFILTLTGLTVVFPSGGNIFDLQSDGQIINGSYSGPECFYCENVRYPGECEQTKLCELQEVCYTQEYFNTTRNATVYRLGCRSALECNLPMAPGTCNICCGLSHCNNLLCDTQAANHRLCYKCAELIHPRYCEIIAPCQLNEEQCYVEKFLSDTYTVRYHSGCMKTKRCDAIKNETVSTKRGQVLTDFCAYCCDSDKCNDDICDHF